MRQTQPQPSRRQPPAARSSTGRPRRSRSLQTAGDGAGGPFSLRPIPSLHGQPALAGSSLEPLHAGGEAGGCGRESQLLSLSAERQELVCSLIGLAVKLGLVALTGVSLFRLAGAYQQRMESQGEIAAVLELENAKLVKARERFDALFMVEGEQRLIREQSQWIAPNRLRVIWQSNRPFPTVESAASGSGNQGTRP
ncbi:hypothetical protein [Cyanobium sp. Candia 9D4]|uniref:hypothetical protein n=1 Tax=Cyanobium sp. Candia 9D4 TaxID=2823707 RepID=UPI0020CF2138|nr:hypothetical protein [Cyanobium sp. Candia 9D4]